MGMERRYGTHRAEFERNKRKLIMAGGVCGICGRMVDTTLKFPNPLSPTIDHIIPLVRGGHPSDIDNLQLAHLACNRAKEDKLVVGTAPKPETNRNLPLSMDWKSYRENVNGET